MFEFEQATVSALLNDDDQFRRLYDKHRDLNTRVDAVNAGNAKMEHFELEIMKKEKDYMSNGKHWITYIPKVKIN